MPLTLTRRDADSIPVDAAGILPGALRGLTRAEIEKRPTWHGNREVPLADLFRVSGDPDGDCLAWEGDMSHVHGIGIGMEEGTIRVHGNAGRHVGQSMRGGEIHVDGDVDDFLGVAMRGGQIHVRGSAGDAVGAALPGATRGMTGGAILVHGSAGDETGRGMRRGLIAVGGDCGVAAGAYMRAGSLFIFGRCGIRPGLGMLRGTIALLGETPPLLPTFQFACRFRPPFAPLVLNQVRELGMHFRDEFLQAEYDLYHGDLVETGRGEVLAVCST